MENTVEYFIERVRSRPCLWNQNHVSFRDMGRKDLTWERIAKECGMSNGREAKIQWKKLRDSHREALRRRKPTHGPSAQYLRPWKYEEDMKFIVTQMDSKEAFYSNDSIDIEDYPNDVTTEIKAEIQNHLPNTTQPNQETTTDPLHIDPNRKRDIAQILEEREKLREERERHRDELLRHAVELSRGDALSKFFDSMCEKTRELPKYMQLRIQREVFESVARAEEEAFTFIPGPVSGYSSTPSSSSHGKDTMVVIARNSQEDCTVEQEEYERKFSVDSS